MSELEALRAELEQLRAENSALQKFVYVASHDLQAPLRSVRGFLQLLERRFGDSLDKDALEFIDMAMSSTQQMQSLISKLLQWSRLDTRAATPVDVDLASVLKKQLEISGGEDRLGRDIKLDVVGSAPVVEMDPGHAAQFFDQLLENSRDYVVSDRDPRITLSCDTGPDGRARFAFADNGRGIAEEYLEKVCQPFFRGAAAEGESSGSGLGLALCQRILNIYGGELRIHSDGESGATVEWLLPAQDKQ